MKALALTLALFIPFFTSPAAPPTVEYKSYGKPIDPSLKDKVFEARVTEVCKKKGCWMTVEDGTGLKRRVRFEDYAFFVPESLVGKRVRLQAREETKEQSESEARHYLKDAGASKEELAKIKGPRVETEWLARSVEVLPGT